MLPRRCADLNKTPSNSFDNHTECQLECILDTGRLGEEMECSSRMGYFEKIVLVEGHVGVREG